MTGLTDGSGNLSFGNPTPAAHNHDGSYQPLDAELSAIAGLTSAANKLPYFAGSGAAALTDLSSAGRALIDDADAAAQRSTLGLGTAATQNTGAFDAAGTAASAVAAHESAGDPHPQYLTATEGNVAYQPLDTELSALAGLTSAANKLPYFSGSGSAALADLSAFGRSLIDDADAAAARSTLGITGGAPEIDINTQSSNYTLQASDQGDLVDFDSTGATLSLLAAATAGDKFHCWVRYRGVATGTLIMDGNSSETIDGLATLTMYAGEVRLLICDGSNWQTMLIAGGYAQFTASGNFIVPSRIRGCVMQVVGGGAGGGGGRGAASGGLRTGGAGGGGGAVHEQQFAAADLGSAGATIPVTIAAQTSAAATNTTGSDGGTTTFGSLLSAYGGGGGRAGQTGSNACGGSGGGTGSAGTTGGSSGTAGGFPRGPGAAQNTPAAGGGGGSSTNGGGAGTSAEYGGGGGGGSPNTTPTATEGGRSLHGGGGGGGGGGCDASNVETAGAAGGLTGNLSSGQSGGGGTLGAVNGGAGGNGSDGPGGLCGSGGGGGGGQDSGTGGTGGDGGAPGGGGGGGGGGTSTGGAGGKGARGECRVWFW